MKRCTKCGVEYPATTEYFHRRGAVPSGLSSHCKTCTNKQHSRWRANNPEKEREYYRREYEQHHEEALARARYYRQMHPEKRRIIERRRYQTNPEEQRERVKSWRRKNPERVRAQNNNRRSRKAMGGTHTAADIRAQLKRQKRRCYYAACGHAKLGDTYHVEHVVPLSRDGSNDPSNIVIACPSCNLSKQAKRPHEWPEGGRLL